MMTFMLLAAALAVAFLVRQVTKPKTRRQSEPVVDRWAAAAEHQQPNYYGNYWAHLADTSPTHGPGRAGARRVPQREDIPVQRVKHGHGQREADHPEGRHQRGSHRPGHTHSRVP
jgi:hypothetical protein